ncbi:MetQ/NlpA family ABC transporter substrate-binding protein [Enterococcus hirae]|nr:MetQ/NlpA family ABC transporter substrate-binding protein [Enterococcus hirae]
MKKKILAFTAIALAALVLTACGSKNQATDGSKTGSSKKEQVLKVGASPTPHAEILEHIKPEMAKKGIKLEIVKFTDYVMPNKALAEKEIDANYFQHKPFFNKAVKENGYKFTDAGAVHIEPMGIYSKRLKSIDDLKDGATLITSNSPSDWGRILTILQDAKLITLKDGVNEETATFDDVAENPKHLTFKHDIAPEILTTAYENDEADLIAINANFAYQKGLNPTKDALLIEKDSSPYANIIAVRTEDKNDSRIKTLMEVLHSKSVQEWMEKKWDGSVKPVDK